jgi:hypothetical protein
MSSDNDTPTHATDLIGSMLAAAEVIGLDEHQVAALSRMYWNSAGRPGAKLVKEAAAHLSPEQFREAVASFTERHVERREGTLSITENTRPADVDALVAAALDKRIKDRAVVEVELASNVADRLIGWSKTFGIFVAAPIGVLLLILSLFGLSKFDDVRKAADRADDLLQRATARIEESNTRLATTEKRAADLTQLATERANDLDQQLGILRNANRQTQTQIATLGQTVRQIETQLGGLSAQRETGNKPPGFIYSSPGPPKHTNYGPWGVDSSVAGEMVKADGFPWREEFSGLEPGSAEFDQAWRTLGEREKDLFRQQQEKFIESHYVEPAVRELSASCGLDVRAHSKTLQEVIWAMAISIPPHDLIEACRKLRDAGQLDPADARLDERLIRAIYEQAKTAWLPDDRLLHDEREMRAAHEQAQKTYEREMGAALEQLAGEQTRRGR